MPQSLPVNQIVMHPDVRQALADHRPVIALETAVITAGLPRDPLDDLPDYPTEGWRADAPINLELGRLLCRIARRRGVTPAVVAVLEGTLHIGLDDAQLERLARDPHALKTSITDLAHRMATGATAGTTVSATLAACTLAQPHPIRVFPTGGIGGVHRSWTDHLDVSADLRQLAMSQVCVVCAGAKAILDVPATIEMLETLGVPTVGYGTDHFPLFYCAGDEQLPVPTRLDRPAEVGHLLNTHWTTLKQPTGVLVATPVPRTHSLDRTEVEQDVILAENLAGARRLTGRDRTPFLLAELARRTEGRSLQANLALLANNVALAADIACELASPGQDS
jgi:pseudouridine-5'-phosphate glycosidase